MRRIVRRRCLLKLWQGRTWPLLVDPPGLSLLERRYFFLLTNSLYGLEQELLIAVKREGQVFLMFFNASFRFSELKALSASISSTASADVLLY